MQSPHAAAQFAVRRTFDSGELLERGPLLLALEGMLHEVASGAGGRMLLIGGEAGVGKTALVSRFASNVGSSVRLLAGACDPLSTPHALAPLFDIADALPEGTLDPSGGRDQLFRDFQRELARARRPTLVIFEDMHWADEATLDLLRFLGRRIGGVRALALVTYRSDEVGDGHPLAQVLGDFATAPAVARMAVEPLSLHGVRTLAAHVGAGIEADELHRLTGGNPFFVTEVLAAGGRALPHTVRDAVLARVGALSAKARASLEVAAVIGSRLEVWLHERVADTPAAALDECLNAGTLIVTAEGLAFRHELARQAILESMSPTRRLQLHRAVLDALRTRPGAKLARLAHHAEAAGEHRAVLEFAPAAADHASSLSAHREAAAQLARAIRAAREAEPSRLPALLEQFAHEAQIASDSTDAITALEEAVALYRGCDDHLAEGRCLARLARVLIGVGRNLEAEQASRHAIELLEALGPSRELASAYSAQAGLRMLDRDVGDAMAWGQKASELAARFGDHESLLSARNVIGSARLLQMDDAGRADLESNLALARGRGMHQYVGLAYVSLGSTSGELHQFAEAERALRAGLAYCQTHELLQHQHYVRAWLALSLMYLGRWDDALTEAAAVLEQRSANTISRITALTATGRVLARRGNDSASDVLDEALELARPTRTLQRLALVRAARAERAWLCGDLERSAEEARPALALSLQHRHPWFAGELLWWLHAAGEAVDVPTWTATPFALQLAGRWDDAATAWESLRCPLERARALGESGAPDAMRQAFHDLESLGAAPLAGRVARRLREVGVRNIPRGPRRTTTENAAGLTRRELEVLRLVADGLRDAEIAARLNVSAKTVGHHVSALLAKLDARSRTEAVKEGRRLRMLEN